MAQTRTACRLCQNAQRWIRQIVEINAVSIMSTLIFPILSALGDPHQVTNEPHKISNFTNPPLSNIQINAKLPDPSNLKSSDTNATSSSDQLHSTQHADTIPREFPTALVVASSIAAVCILVFFTVSYIWHTRQLDSRARKLAIQLAASAEVGLRRGSSGSSSNIPLSRHQQNNNLIPSQYSSRGYSRTFSEDSSQEQNTCEALTIEDEQPATIGGGSEGGRSSLVVSESDTADFDDTFDTPDLPSTQLTRGSSRLGRVGRNAHRKWSRSSRKSSGAPSLDGKRDSAVTDKEILSHFANRRHSTFFI